MRRIFLLAPFLALTLAACSSGGSAEDDAAADAPLVVATTSQIGALVREVAGDAVEVKTLIGPGVDPHDYEPSPADVRHVGDAALVLRNGIGLDGFLDDIIEGSGAQTVITVTEGITLRAASGEHEEEEHAEGDGHDHEGEFDPHVWQSPANVKLMTASIVEALAVAFPEDATTFRKNGTAYAAHIDEVDGDIGGILDEIPVADRRMVTDHDAFGYFLDYYGIELVGTVIPGTSTKADPSAQDIAALEELIESTGVKAIFSESSIDPKVATQVAADTGVEIVDDLYGDTLGDPASEAGTVDGMLLFNARRIADALK